MTASIRYSSLLLVMVALCTACSAPEPTEAQPVATSRNPDVSVSAATLFAAFKENELNAEAQYKGKVLKVHGQVQSVGRTNRGVLYVQFVSSDPMGVQALFDDGDAAALADINPGDYINILCRYDNARLNVILSGCTAPK